MGKIKKDSHKYKHSGNTSGKGSRTPNGTSNSSKPSRSLAGGEGPAISSFNGKTLGGFGTGKSHPGRM